MNRNHAFQVAFYRPQRSCCKEVFTPVCGSVHSGGVCLGVSVKGVSVWGGGGGVSVQQGVYVRETPLPLPYGYLRAVRILLECILVSTFIELRFEELSWKTWGQGPYHLVSCRKLEPCSPRHHCRLIPENSFC